MKTTKAFLCIMLILVISLSLSACSSSSAVPAPSKPEATQAGSDLDPGKTAAETDEAAETEAPATEQPEAPEPKLCEEVTLTHDGVTSWITYTYEGDRLVRKHDSYRGTESVYTFSEDGKPISDTDSSGNVTEYSYNEAGKTIVTKDSVGNVTGESRYNLQEKLIYINSTASRYITLKDDQDNEIFHYSKSGGVAQELSYDELGRVSEIVSHSSIGDGHLNFEYSPDGLHLDVMASISGTSTLYTEVDYDGAGHIVKETDHSAKIPFITTWTYDEHGWLVEEAQYYGDVLKIRYAWEYDENGRNSCRIDENPDYTTTHYYLRDENGRVIDTYEEQEDPTNNEIVYTILESRHVYNDRGALEKTYTYNSSAETWEDWSTVIFYFYEGDEIPHNVGQLIP